MIDIKFRGINKITGKFVYGFYAYIGVKRENGHMEFAHMILDSSSKDAEGLKQYEVLYETVGRYTGVKDKNGKEIYDEDIIKVKNFIGKVIYEEKTCQYILTDNLKTIYYWWKETNEVIGNVYENQEFLKELIMK